MISLLLFAPCPFLAQETSFDYSYSTSGNPPGPVFWICWSVFVILMVAAMWKVFTKAGQPGWAALIPIVNVYFLCKVAGRPGWWLILMLIPLVNFIILIMRAIPRRSTAATGLSQALLRPVRFPSFVKRRDAFARFGGFARAHVML